MHRVQAKGILSSNNGMNVYRGCSHGCIYCDSRSKCYQMNHAFEDIEVKENAPELLEKALKSKKKKCMIGTGAMCDPYVHLEMREKITRKCLEVIESYGFGLAIQTKSDRILRDLDLLKKINENGKCVVQMTLTTFDDDLCRMVEPNVCCSSRRIEVLNIMKENNIPTIVWLCPLLPWINDTKKNVLAILEACYEAGVKGIICFGMGVTLREGNREYFYQCLDEKFPGLKQKYIERYGNSYEISSPREAELYRVFIDFCKEHNMMYTPEQCFKYMNEFPQKQTQLSLF